MMDYILELLGCLGNVTIKDEDTDTKKAAIEESDTDSADWDDDGDDNEDDDQEDDDYKYNEERDMKTEEDEEDIDENNQHKQSGFVLTSGPRLKLTEAFFSTVNNVLDLSRPSW